MTPSPARYTWGADEHLFVEIDDEMSLDGCLRAMALAKALGDQRLPGVLDICPSNASYQVRFDPDVVPPTHLLSLAKDLEVQLAVATDVELETRVIEIPVLYDDPWTRETLERFPGHRQNPELTDLEFSAQVNGFGDVEGFIKAHHASPWITSMVGFVAGLPFLYQMVPRERQLQVPKYIRPRTDTPARAVAQGGCFGSIYSVRGAGGYQMFGITPVPIYDPAQRLPDFGESPCYFGPGDIVKFVPIDRSAYDDLVEKARLGKTRIRTRPVRFRPSDFTADPEATTRALLEVLDGD